MVRLRRISYALSILCVIEGLAFHIVAFLILATLTNAIVGFICTFQE